jgi:CrcB protein
LNAWHIAVVGAGGALGAVARYLVTLALLAWWPSYPGVGTLLVNVAGSFAIGALLGLGVQHHWLTTELRLFLVTGVMGGLTTFSSLAWETVLFTREPPIPGGGLTHLAANVLLGLSALIVGEWLARLLAPVV